MAQKSVPIVDNSKISCLNCVHSDLCFVYREMMYKVLPEWGCLVLNDSYHSWQAEIRQSMARHCCEFELRS